MQFSATLASFLTIVSCASPTLKIPEPEPAAVASEAATLAREAVKRESEAHPPLTAEERAAYVKAVMADQVRLARVSHRIAVRLVDLCGERSTLTTGALLYDWDQTADEWVDAANDALGINLHTPGIEVLIVNPDSPAEKAGLQVGDRIMRLDDWRVPPWRGALGMLRQRLQEKFARGDSAIEFRIQRGSRFRTVHIDPIRACDYPALLQDVDEINAYTDGQKVVVFRGMMGVARDDDELAMVVSHELAHVLLGHIDIRRQQAMAGIFIGTVFDVLIAAATGVSTQGLGRTIGADIGAMAFSKELEAEADYMGSYLVARGGYDYAKGPDFWRHIARIDDKPEDYGTMHPTTPERVLATEETVEEIKRKIEAGLPLLPEYKAKAGAE